MNIAYHYCRCEKVLIKIKYNSSLLGYGNEKHLFTPNKLFSTKIGIICIVNTFVCYIRTLIFKLYVIANNLFYFQLWQLFRVNFLYYFLRGYKTIFVTTPITQNRERKDCFYKRVTRNKKLIQNVLIETY